MTARRYSIVCGVALLGLAACGRLGFGLDSTAQSTDDGGPLGDSIDAPGAGTTDASPDAPPPAATVNFIASTSSTNNNPTYTFNNVSIGTPAVDRIVVVSAFLGGGAITPITSIVVEGTTLALTGQVTDGVSGSWAVGYAAIATGATATIAVSSANAGRAAIAVYNVTATSPVPIDAQVNVDPVNSAAAISTSITAQPGGVVIANAGYGSNTPTWSWSGSWTGYSVNLNTSWGGEQGTYTTAAASTSTAGALTITATPSGSTPKVLNAVVWR